jgi:endonuclease YncB( thermonuclease family)
MKAKRSFARRRKRADAGLVLVLGLAVLAAAQPVLDWLSAFLTSLALRDSEILIMSLAAISAAIIAAAVPTGVVLMLWHGFANAVAEKTPHAMAKPWVIDGDTIDDRASGIRYRLANIDAPETGDNAKCHRERMRGEEATRAAIRLVRSAAQVQVRPTFRRDRYGRRVAFVLVDGRDLGEELMARGLAQPWRGWRRKWCGPNGGLAKSAARSSTSFSCNTCQGWR